MSDEIRDLPRSENVQFWRARDQWRADCLREYNTQFDEQRTNTTEQPGDIVEFADCGSAFPHGSGGTSFIPYCVTPWQQSPHFVQ